MNGQFVVFEGGEACGKSTQARLLADDLDALLTHEPGGTDLGARIRALVLDDDLPIDPRAEALLMTADRAHHVTTVIQPTLATGRHVVCDRFSGSTLAYQGHGRGLDVSWLESLCDWSAHGLQPDLVVLLDVPPSVARARRTGADDRVEAAGPDFHERVRAGFLDIAHARPDRWWVVDGEGPVESLARRIRTGVAERLGLDAEAR